MKLRTKIGLSFIAILFGFALNVSYATPNTDSTDTHTYETLNDTAPLSYMPRVYLDGYGGYSSGSLYMGTAELLQPVLLRYDRDLFIYGEGRFSNYQPNESWASSPWSGSLGVGYRQILAQSWVVGGYLLGGYSKTPTDHGIIYANPGLEALGKVWDFRLNGYIPVSKTKWETQGWADNFGNNNYVTYQGHDEYDAWFIYHETAGIGGDAQVGRKLFTYKNTLVKGYVDGYYFSEGTNKGIMGGGAKITAQPNSYLKFSLSDNYDNNVHNVAMFGVEISLYDLFANRSKTITGQDLQHRLFEPIDHNFAATGSGNVIPTAGGPERGKPNVIQYGPSNPVNPYVGPYNGHNTPERTNVWFFNGGNSGANAAGNGIINVADGTYEHPFSGRDFTQNWLKHIYDSTIVNGANTNAYLYFTKGQYNAYTSPDSFNYSYLELFPGESLWGRMGGDKGYQNPATGADRPTFVGGLQLDSNTSINDLILQNNHSLTGFDTGITMDAAANVRINDVVIGANDSNTGYTSGIVADNDSELSINNSDIYAYSDSGDMPAANGITLGNSTINIGNNNIIAATTKAGSGKDTEMANAAGIFALSSEINISGNHNTISATTNGGSAVSKTADPAEATVFSTGLNAYGSTVTISGDDNTISATANGGAATSQTTGGTKAYANASASATGLFADDSTVTISGNNNTISAEAIGGDASAKAATHAQTYATAGAIGMSAQDNSTVTISGNNNTISATVVSDIAQAEVSTKSDGYPYANAGSDAQGISIDHSSLTISGSNNKISAKASSNKADVVFAGYMQADGPLANSSTQGIFAKNSTVTISGNNNSISATAIGGTNIINGVKKPDGNGTAFGINAQFSTINFSSKATGNTIIVGGTKGNAVSTGIYADSASKLLIDGAVPTNLNDFTNLRLISFQLTGAKNGYKIEGNNATLDW